MKGSESGARKTHYADLSLPFCGGVAYIIHGRNAYILVEKGSAAS